MTLYRQLGDYRLLKPGGVADQPLIWFACNRTGYILEKIRKWQEGSVKAGSITDPDEEKLFELYVEIVNHE